MKILILPPLTDASAGDSVHGYHASSAKMKGFSVNPQPVVIVGPTAGGKSSLAFALARHLATRESQPAQIINADSMQIYRYMDAGTAKPTHAMRQVVTHHLIDIVNPGEVYTVANWLEQTEQLIQSLANQSIRSIIVGGTNLYLKSLLQGMDDMPGRDEAYREKIANISSEILHDQLAQIDPAAAQRIHRNDRKRITRALEVHHLTGKPISDWQTQWQDDAPPSHRHNALLVGLNWPTDTINQRINLRVKAMFYPDKVDTELAAEVCIGGRSLIDEVQDLQARDLLGPSDCQARQALGYKQVLEALEGKMSIEEAYEQTKVQTRRFAKQQRTWLRRYQPIHWINADDTDMNDKLAQIDQWLNQA